MPRQNAEALLTAQKAFFATGATLPVPARIDALKSLSNALKKHETALLRALKEDLGKSETESYMCEIGLIHAEIRHMLRHVRAYAAVRRVRTPLTLFPSKSMRFASPYGCTLIMSPWNYPIHLTLIPLVDALAAGNTAIVKPSAYAPHCAEALRDMLSECFSEKLVAVVTGGREANALLLDLTFDKIFFTGSVAVGREVLRHAAERLIPVTLELGGKSPCLIDESADLEIAARRIVNGKFVNCGQTCVAPDYVCCDKRVVAPLVQALKKEIIRQYGSVPLDNPDYGKIISPKHYSRLIALIAPEKIVFGGECDAEALRIAPTILRDVTREDAIMKEEIFGPLLPILSYDNFEDMLADVAAHPSPLALYVFSKDKAHIRHALTALRFGGGCVNDTLIHLATNRMGFGGVGESGMGAYHGKDGFDAFSHTKSVVQSRTDIDLPLRYAPYTPQKRSILRRVLR